MNCLLNSEGVREEVRDGRVSSTTCLTASGSPSREDSTARGGREGGRDKGREGGREERREKEERAK